MDSIPLMIPELSEEDIIYASQILQSGKLVQGTKVEELEVELAKYIGVEHVVAVSSGTAALHLSLMALDIGLHDEVIIPAFSFMATANVVEVVGSNCIFCDIQSSTFNIDVDKIEEKITSRTKAIIPVHEFGLTCNINEIMEIAKRHKLAVIEDAACAIGSLEGGAMAGSFGDIGCFSFHPRKIITSGEGGALSTNNQKLADKLRGLRNHGITQSDGVLEFSGVGLNCRMTDFQAVLLLGQLRRINTNLQKRREIADMYYSGFKFNKNIVAPMVNGDKYPAWQTYHIMTSNNKRDELIKHLEICNIGSNIGAQCIPSQRYYKNKYNLDVVQEFPNAFEAFAKGIAIPIYSSLLPNQVDRVIQNVNGYFSN